MNANAKKAKTEQFVKLPASLIRSPSLRNLPIHAFRVVLAVMDEHNRKGGKENGILVAPHKTLKLWIGTSDKTSITLAIKQAEALGLLAVAGGYVGKDGTKVPNRYRLTWLPGHNGGPPSDDWKDVTSDDQAKDILATLKKRRPKTARYITAELAGKLGTKWSNENEDQERSARLNGAPELQRLQPSRDGGNQ